MGKFYSEKDKENFVYINVIKSFGIFSTKVYMKHYIKYLKT